jgi:hypothetical protein
MNVDYVPLVRVMREIHGIPRGQPPDFNGKKRFRHYLRTIFDYDRKVCKLPPLLAMNPMQALHRAVRSNSLALGFETEATVSLFFARNTDVADGVIHGVPLCGRRHNEGKKSRETQANCGGNPPVDTGWATRKCIV